MQEWELPVIMSDQDTTDQFSRMINLKNKKKMVILPQVSPLDHHHQQQLCYNYNYSYGLLSEVPMPYTETAENKYTLNANEIINSRFYQNYSNLYYQQNQQQFHLHDQPLPFNINYSTVPPSRPQPAASTATFLESNNNNNNNNNNRRRKSEQIPYEEKTSENIIIINDKLKSNYKKKKKKKKNKGGRCCGTDTDDDKEQYSQFLKDPNYKQVDHFKGPVRRSQKLADKITALQKLVSPYGKTDTASVLYEASIFIKVLQDQIQKEMDVRNKKLGLIPISLAQIFVERGLTEEENTFAPYNCSFREN